MVVSLAGRDTSAMNKMVMSFSTLSNYVPDTDKHFKYANEKSPAMLLVKTYQRATDVCDNLMAKIKTAALKRELNRSTSKIATLYLMLRHFTLNPQNFPHPSWHEII